MARLITVIAALSAFAPSVLAGPQGSLPERVCTEPNEEYEVTDISEPYSTKAESVGGAHCTQGNGINCQHHKGFEHTFGITQSLSGGISGALDVAKIFDIGACFWL